MKSRTLLRDRGHNVPVEAYHGHRAEPELKQELDGPEGPEGGLTPEDCERNAETCDQNGYRELAGFWRDQAGRLNGMESNWPDNPLEFEMR